MGSIELTCPGSDRRAAVRRGVPMILADVVAPVPERLRFRRQVVRDAAATLEFPRYTMLRVYIYS